jgi:hypothetical protein
MVGWTATGLKESGRDMTYYPSIYLEWPAKTMKDSSMDMRALPEIQTKHFPNRSLGRYLCVNPSSEVILLFPQEPRALPLCQPVQWGDFIVSPK